MLNFDSWQRCETARNLLNWALPESGAIVLDVGGYPGRMQSMAPQHDWVICDPRADAPGNQVRAGGENLPFADSVFDFCVCLDVLEHIAPEKRPLFLSEMRRVAKQGIILSFPHNHPLVIAAEKNIGETYRRLYEKDHPWLGEHAQYPLPEIEEIAAQLKKQGGESAIFNVGSLRRWTQLQSIDILLEAIPGSLDAAKKLDEWYKEKLFPCDFNPPTYRKMILHLFAAEEPLSLGLVHPSMEEETEADNEFFHRAVLEILNLLLSQQASFKPKEPIPPLDEKKEPKEISEEKTEEKEEPLLPVVEEAVAGEMKEYVQRLERSLQLWEETYSSAIQRMADISRWRDNLEKRKSFKIYKRIAHLFGRKIEN
ncbi:MAG: class I SAM-dependent methyltransferase [Candidatus Omnitrophota bacterium]